MLSDEEMTHLATLARLELSPNESHALRDDLNKLLGYFDSLNALDTENVQELVRPIDAHNIFRPDCVNSGLQQRAVAALAIEQDEGFFKVPRTVDGSDA